MIRHLRNDKPVATVMTSVSSEIADATRAARIGKKTRFDDSIFRPKDAPKD
jgi:hypothetical protein